MIGTEISTKNCSSPTSNKRWPPIVIATIFILLIGTSLLSLALFFFLGSFMELYIRKYVVATDGTIARLTEWADPSLYSVRAQMYTYSVRNPDQITRGVVPSVGRFGPYAFDLVQKRRHFRNQTDNNGTAQYDTRRTYEFNRAASCGECSLRDRVWVPNLVRQRFVDEACKPAINSLATAAVALQKPFMEVEVDELLFDGYTDPFLDEYCATPIGNFTCQHFIQLPDRIGLFYKQNGTSNGVFSVVDGSRTENGQNLGQIVAWNGLKSLPDEWWESKQSLQLNGTDGTLFPPYLDKNERLHVFMPDMCRSFPLVFQKEVHNDEDGVMAYRFVVPKDSWDWSLEWNEGFCNSDNPKKLFEQQQQQLSDCLPSGLLDISRCRIGEPPIVLSLPNFLYAPEFVQKSIDGIRRPAQELDQIEFDIEPRLGLVLQAHRRFLYSITMRSGANLTTSDQQQQQDNIRSSIIPVLEVDEHTRIDEANSGLIMARKLIRMEKLLMFGCIFIGTLSLLAVAVLTIVLFIRRRKNVKKSSGSAQSTTNDCSPSSADQMI